MARGELTPFSYAILALVGEGGAGPHDIVRMMRQGRTYWAAAESHYYAEPKRLAGLGYLVSRKEAGRTRERTHYELTDLGRKALRDWIAEPATLPRIQHEAVVKLLAADLSDDETVCASLGAMRADIAEAYRELDTAEEIARTIPHRERYLLLVHGLGRRLLAAHEDWLDDLERKLAGTKSSRRSSVR